MNYIYHASSIGDIKMLKPSCKDGKLYFSRKRENVLVYLVNAVKKCCEENGVDWLGSVWGPYGFTNEGKFRLEEYYPNATFDTYHGMKAYIYRAIESDDMKELYIKDALCCDHDVAVESVEEIDDAYQEIIKAINDGKIDIVRYEDASDGMIKWIENTTCDEYEKGADDYKFFLKTKFPNILNDVQ